MQSSTTKKRPSSMHVVEAQARVKESLLLFTCAFCVRAAGANDNWLSHGGTAGATGEMLSWLSGRLVAHTGARRP